MIQQFELDFPREASASMKLGSIPARICISSDIRDFAGIWPRSTQLGDARCHAFQCADLLELHCETISVARNAQPLFVAILGQNDQPLALLPLSLETDPRYTRVFKQTRVLRFLDDGLSDYNAPVMFAPVRDWSAKTVRMLWDAVREHIPAFDIAIFDKMPESVDGMPNPLCLLQTSAREGSGHGAALSGTWKEFSAKLPSRSNLRRLTRRLGERGSLTFEVAETAQQCDVAMEALTKYKRERSLETLGHDPLERPGYREYLSKARELVYPCGPVCVFTLKLDDKIIAANFCCVAGSRLIGQICSFDPEWYEYSPGRLLFEKIFEWCFSHGIAFYDFGIGNETYKDSYCDVVIPLRDAVMAASAKGIASLLWRDTIDRIRKAARKVQTTAPAPEIKDSRNDTAPALAEKAKRARVVKPAARPEHSTEAARID